MTPDLSDEGLKKLASDILLRDINYVVSILKQVRRETREADAKLMESQSCCCGWKCGDSQSRATAIRQMDGGK